MSKLRPHVQRRNLQHWANIARQYDHTAAVYVQKPEPCPVALTLEHAFDTPHFIMTSVRKKQVDARCSASR
eukprot:7386461-Prymnesium_polylepis.1